MAKKKPDADTKNPIQLQLLLILGIVFILADIIKILPAELGIPIWMGPYLILTGGYFAIDPHKRVEERRQEMLVYACFPGAFATLLIPFYAGLVLVAESGLI